MADDSRWRPGKPLRIIPIGDVATASEWIPFARRKMVELSRFGDYARRTLQPADGVVIRGEMLSGIPRVFIEVEKPDMYAMAGFLFTGELVIYMAKTPDSQYVERYRSAEFIGTPYTRVGFIRGTGDGHLAVSITTNSTTTAKLLFFKNTGQLVRTGETAPFYCNTIGSAQYALVKTDTQYVAIVPTANDPYAPTVSSMLTYTWDGTLLLSAAPSPPLNVPPREAYPPEVTKESVYHISQLDAGKIVVSGMVWGGAPGLHPVFSWEAERVANYLRFSGDGGLGWFQNDPWLIDSFPYFFTYPYAVVRSPEAATFHISDNNFILAIIYYRCHTGGAYSVSFTQMNISYSLDNGLSYTVPVPLPAPLTNSNVSYCPVGGSVVVAHDTLSAGFEAPKKIYRSTDYGVTWVKIADFVGGRTSTIRESILVSRKHVSDSSPARLHFPIRVRLPTAGSLNKHKLVIYTSEDGGYTWAATTEFGTDAAPLKKEGWTEIAVVGSSQHAISPNVLAPNIYKLP